MEIMSVLNPYYNKFLNEEYSGSAVEGLYFYPFINITTPNVTVNSITNDFGNLVLSLVVDEYNALNGTTFSYTDFGIAPLTNDQNSRCAYLIFPLLTNIPVLFRLYIELSNNDKISFNSIKYISAPNYYPIPTGSNLINVVRCNMLLSPLVINNYSLVNSIGNYKFNNYNLEFVSCPTVISSSLISVLPETFILNRRINYITNETYNISSYTSSSFELGNNLPNITNIDLTIGNGLLVGDFNTNEVDFTIGNGLTSTNSTSNTTTFTIGST